MYIYACACLMYIIVWEEDSYVKNTEVAICEPHGSYFSLLFQVTVHIF